MTARAAIFDVDGTLVRANALDYYLFFVRHLCPPANRFLRLLAVSLWAPYWIQLDRTDRARFNRSFYRQYRRLRVAEVRSLAETCFQSVLLPRLIPETLHRAQGHRDRGDRILLASGTLDFILAPLARHLGAEAVLCPGLADENGLYQGRIVGRNVAGPVKTQAVAEYAQDHGIDLSTSHAYADSLSDVSLLKSVGHPVVVGSDRRLMATALRLGWERISIPARWHAGAGWETMKPRTHQRDPL